MVVCLDLGGFLNHQATAATKFPTSSHNLLPRQAKSHHIIFILLTTMFQKLRNTIEIVCITSSERLAFIQL